MTPLARLSIAFSLVLAAPLACIDPDPAGTDSATGTATTGTATITDSTDSTATQGTTGGTDTTDATGTQGTDPTTGVATGSTGEPPPPPPAAVCGMAGGICVGQDTCAMAGGTVAADSPGGCFFDDGPAECCIPPAPKPGAMTCADAGGLCAPIGGCLDAGGYLTSNDAGCEFQGNFACCVPQAQCGPQTIECCTDSAVYNPTCDDGMFVCLDGMPVPFGTCPV